MIVMKFGGTSIESPERIRQVYKIVKKTLDKKPIIVASAVGGVTDMLIDAAKNAVSCSLEVNALMKPIRERHVNIIRELALDMHSLEPELSGLEKILQGISLIGELSPKTMDNILSFGERMSSKILSLYFTSEGMKSIRMTGWEAGILTDSNHQQAEILPETYVNVKERFAIYDGIPVVTGFIAKDKNGSITTLGRGGSDYTASIIGSAIGAEEIQIWTDVDGILSTDPRIVNDAFCISEVSFDEASELSYFGAKVLHPKTIHPAVKKNIPIRVMNTKNPNHAGTLILNEIETERIYTAIAFKRNITIVRICSLRMFLSHGFLAKIFEIFSKNNISVDVVSTSEVSVSVTLDNVEGLEKAIFELEKFATVDVSKNNAVICIVGPGMDKGLDNSSRIFAVCSENDINVKMISYGAASLNITFAIDDFNLEKCVKALHKELFSGGN